MNEVSLSKGHPIEKLDEIRAIYKAAGIPITVRFRGPRRKNSAGRTTFCGQLTCLKADAVSFAVYRARGR